MRQSNSSSLHVESMHRASPDRAPMFTTTAAVEQQITKAKEEILSFYLSS